MERTSLDTIEDFLAQKRIAMVGVSREQKDFSVMLFEELCRRGYDVVPVNPELASVSGRHCVERVQDIKPAVDGALLMTSPSVTDVVVRDCAEAGIERVWMYRAAGAGAVSRNAIEFCRGKGIAVVAGECPYMFLPGNGLHKVHGLVRRIARSYPQRASAPAA